MSQDNVLPLQEPAPRVFAALDLGSNSFHLTIAEYQHENLHILGKIKDKVQLAAGLSNDGFLSEEAIERGLNCLRQFQQRLETIPQIQVQALATHTLRKAKNANVFLQQAEAILGFPIDVISGYEEARLIYNGVAHFNANQKKRFVIDIGGGSTEFIIGQQFDPIKLSSLQMGCVSYRDRFFPDGKLSREGFEQAVAQARTELFEVAREYRKEGWDIVEGSSGTIESVLNLCEVKHPNEPTITWQDLKRIRKQIFSFDNLADINLNGLSENRREILPSGLAILMGIFKSLKIETMYFSPAALREGMIYELAGELSDRNIRDRSIQGLGQRYHVDVRQAKRVAELAERLYNQVKAAWGLDDTLSPNLLNWAAATHEIGRSINYHSSHRHGEYIIQNSDIAGFSYQLQNKIALLVRSHRKKFPIDLFHAEVIEPQRDRLIKLAKILRLAVCLHHRRSDSISPEFKLSTQQGNLCIRFPSGWLDDNSLVEMDLLQEKIYMQQSGYDLFFD